MEYATIISQSSTEHIINPAPYKPFPLRVQALCGFSVDPTISAQIASNACAFCDRELAIIRERER